MDAKETLIETLRGIPAATASDLEGILQALPPVDRTTAGTQSGGSIKAEVQGGYGSRGSLAIDHHRGAEGEQTGYTVGITTVSGHTMTVQVDADWGTVKAVRVLIGADESEEFYPALRAGVAPVLARLRAEGVPVVFEAEGPGRVFVQTHLPRDRRSA